MASSWSNAVADAHAKTATPSSWDGNIPPLRIKGTTQYYNMNLTPGFKANVMAKMNTILVDEDKFKWSNGAYIAESDWSTAPLIFAGNSLIGTNLSLPQVTSKDYRLPFYRQVDKSGVKVISSERRVLPSELGTVSQVIDNMNRSFPYSTHYSPFCLQELEAISWSSNLLIFLENDYFNILIALDGGQYA